MKKIILYVYALAMALNASPALADFDGAFISTEAFVNEAKEKLGKMGAGASGELFFQDGAYGADITPFDGAELIFKSRTSIKLGQANLFAAYRLRLSTGETEVVFMDLADGYRVTSASTDGGDFKVVLREGWDPRDVLLVEEIIRANIKNSDIMAFGQIGLVYFTMPNYSLQAFLSIVKSLEKEVPGSSVEFGIETYRAPFVFGKPIKLKPQKALDLDALRSVSRNLLNDGLEFTTSSSRIPERFSPSF